MHSIKTSNSGKIISRIDKDIIWLSFTFQPLV
jgi:hypothetical protein